MSPALHSSDVTHEPAPRILLPLPLLAGVPTPRCPYCGAHPVSLEQPRSFTCGAAWSGPAGRTPCGAPPSRILLARLRGWCLEHRLYAAAALLRRYLPRTPTLRCDEGLGWLLPQGLQAGPSATCPCCGAPVRARDPGCWHYDCGCVLLRVSAEDAVLERWLACMPCQQPGLGSILDALATLPDNPLDAGERARLLRLLVQDCWI
jgi:hypothetical protein